MKKNISILLIVLCTLVISTLILFAEEVKYDFRQTNWGMSVEQVKATEKNKIAFEDEETIAMDRVQVRVNWSGFPRSYSKGSVF